MWGPNTDAPLEMSTEEGWVKSESGLLIPVVLDDLANELEHELDPLPGDSPLGRVGFSPLPIGEEGQGDIRLRDVREDHYGLGSPSKRARR
jgi:hypothetical protein